MSEEISKLEIRKVQTDLTRLRTELMQLESKIIKVIAKGSDARKIIINLNKIIKDLEKIHLKASD